MSTQTCENWRFSCTKWYSLDHCADFHSTFKMPKKCKNGPIFSPTITQVQDQMSRWRQKNEAAKLSIWQRAILDDGKHKKVWVWCPFSCQVWLLLCRQRFPVLDTCWRKTERRVTERVPSCAWVRRISRLMEEMTNAQLEWETAASENWWAAWTFFFQGFRHGYFAVFAHNAERRGS